MTRPLLPGGLAAALLLLTAAALAADAESVAEQEPAPAVDATNDATLTDDATPATDDATPASEGATPAADDAAPTDDGRLNPHARADACQSCHEAGESPEAQGPARPSIATCSECHPDVKMHAVGQAPIQTHTPEGWPLEDGVIACATCHAEPSCDAQRPQAAPWNRGGPYPDPDLMCWQCHDRADYGRSDPHHPELRRDPQDPTCPVCHDTVPAEGADVANSELRLEEEELCAFCHEGERHSGADVHMGAKVETIDPKVGGLVALDSQGQIACWTCHEVHGDREEPRAAKPSRTAAESIRSRLRAEDWHGLLPDDVVWPGAVHDEEHPPLLGLAGDSALCSACHGDGP